MTFKSAIRHPSDFDLRFDNAFNETKASKLFNLQLSFSKSLCKFVEETLVKVCFQAGLVSAQPAFLFAFQIGRSTYVILLFERSYGFHQCLEIKSLILS